MQVLCNNKDFLDKFCKRLQHFYHIVVFKRVVMKYFDDDILLVLTH